MPKVRAGARSRSRRGTCGSRRGRAGCTFQRDVCRRCGRCGSGARARRGRRSRKEPSRSSRTHGRTTRTSPPPSPNRCSRPASALASNVHRHGIRGDVGVGVRAFGSWVHANLRAADVVTCDYVIFRVTQALLTPLLLTRSSRPLLPILLSILPFFKPHPLIPFSLTCGCFGLIHFKTRSTLHTGAGPAHISPPIPASPPSSWRVAGLANRPRSGPAPPAHPPSCIFLGLLLPFISAFSVFASES
jgi:hypothetical protein